MLMLMGQSWQSCSWAAVMLMGEGAAAVMLMGEAVMIMGAAAVMLMGEGAMRWRQGGRRAEETRAECRDSKGEDLTLIGAECGDSKGEDLTLIGAECRDSKGEGFPWLSHMGFPLDPSLY